MRKELTTQATPVVFTTRRHSHRTGSAICARWPIALYKTTVSKEPSGKRIHDFKAEPFGMRCLWVQPLVIQIKTDDLRGVGCCRNRKLRAATGGLQHTLAVDVRHQPGNCCFNSFHCSLRFIPKTHASGAFASNQKYPSDISSSNTLASRSNIMGLYGLAPTLRFF